MAAEAKSKTSGEGPPEGEYSSELSSLQAEDNLRQIEQHSHDHVTNGNEREWLKCQWCEGET